MVGLENRLSDLLGVQVDLAPAQMLKRPVVKRAAQEAILAYYIEKLARTDLRAFPQLSPLRD